MAVVPVSISDVDSSIITHYKQLLSMSSRSDPRRPIFDLPPASMRPHHYTLPSELSSERESLDKAIAHFVKSILLPLSPPRYDPIILDALFFLAYSLFMHSRVSKQPEYVIYAANYLFHLRHQPHEIPTVPRHKVTALLIDTLALQVELEAGDAMRAIREMIVLSHELLTLETSGDATRLIGLIYGVVVSKISPDVPDQPLDELIQFLRAARKHRPDQLEGHIALAISLVSRYYMFCANDDYEEAASVLDGIIAYTSLRNSQDEYIATARAFAMGFASLLAMMRSTAYETPEHLEEAIYHACTCSSSSSFNELYPSIVFDPGATAAERFSYFGSIEGVEESPVGGDSLLVPGMLDINQTLDRMKDLLFGIRANDDTMDIDGAIDEGRTILASSPHPSTLALFGGILDEAFRRTNSIEYLDESITILRQEIEPPSPLAVRIRTLPRLSQSLLSRSHFFPGYRTQDLDEALELLSECVSSSHPSLPYRFRYAFVWALTARRTRHPSVSSAYDSALSLMQDTVLFSPTLQLKYTTLDTTLVADSDDKIHTSTLPLDYASYLVDNHQLEEAIETLERGRALLWSEMRHLRASIDQLRGVDPDLGRRLAAVNRDLEELTKSVPPSHRLSVDYVIRGGLRAVDPFGRLLLKQRGLLNERTELISRIQTLPGFDSFLTSPSFDTLRSAASSGPVIIINHSRWRSDILILLHNMPPSLISTPDDFYRRASALKDKLLDSRRNYGLDSGDYEETLASILQELYELVGQPVIDRLHQLQVPEQSRIWWCPTSVFCSLPLHAMGPIPSDDGEPRYFLDLYICSYTPTLSTLIQSRHRDSNPRSSDRPSILLVAQPDPSLPTVGGVIRVVQALDTEVTSLISEAATPATVIDGLHRHQFVHISTHATLETGKPFEAGFELHGDRRLTLLDIVRLHLPAAEFAFLCTCHTAELTEGSILDEGLHLAAAFQYCGFRSVVGTMWAMSDEDDRDLAKFFYRALFSNSRRDHGIPYHERSADALRSAVRKLRRKRGITLERWVNFVHYGA